MHRDLDYFQLLKEAKRSEGATGRPEIRVAILADCATQQFIPMLRALYLRGNLDPVFYEGGFDAIELESRNPSSGLYKFKPDVILILNTVQALRDRYYQRAGSGAAFQQHALQRVLAVWDALKQKSDTVVIQSNFAVPLERFFGNYDQKVEESLSSIVLQLNAAIAAEARTRNNVLFLDVNAVASWIGRKAWFDERMWSIAKQFCGTDYLPVVAQNIVDISLAMRGRAVKCIVIDLDNTIWGGIVGDDGPHGIQISAHGEGEPFYRFQAFLKELKKRGILLAVCSKNEHENAIKPFLENPEMVLKLEDITVFVANWGNKAENLKQIRDTLNIGMDSIVFVDDNPFERNVVRTLVPDAIVPEMPEDPADYVKVLCELNLFETTSFSAEDTQRADLYRQEAQRKVWETTASSFEEFLQSLGMTIEVSRFVPEQLGRITQLMQRSNQFNLTTQRYNQAQCEAMMTDVEACLPLFAKLRDRFGDHGLISIVIARPDRAAGVLNITDWLMSCRVLTRGVEEYLMNHLLEEAKRSGLSTVAASYIPTSKNGMVKEFYARFGFERRVEHSDGRIDWVLNVAEYCPRQVFIIPETARTQAAAI